MNDIVSISDFNRGKAAHIFKTLEESHRKIVVRNNRPIGILLSIDAFVELTEKAENNALLAEALQRMSYNKPTYSTQEVMDNLGISAKELEEIQADEFV
ncbi:MAG: hypothetical protein RBR15_01965 [Sphaerochaeta sp.]|nr:hypothetical protein [Sphaerochaeta sp.]